MTKLRVSLPMTIERSDGDGCVAWRFHPSRHTVDFALFDDHVEVTIHECTFDGRPRLPEMISNGWPDPA